MNTCPTCQTRHPDAVRICPHDGTVLTPDAAPDPRVGTTLDGKYRLDTFLGRGGMGSIYRGTHLMLDKPVAVKLINPDLVTSTGVVRRFQREARAASNLSHPNIAAAYDLGQTPDGTLYIAMELVSGESLKDAIRLGGPMAPARIVHILRQVASALAAAHAGGIIHRDLKPQNIMLAREPDGSETAKLLDFGIAKTFNDAATHLTTTGLVLGTPQYMSPEQAAGRAIDGRSDLYSLGIILFEMLVGEVPFNDPSTPAVLVKHLTEAAPLPSRRRPDLTISPALELIVLQCLEKDPAARFQSANEFAAALDAAVGTLGAGRAAVAGSSDRTVAVAPRADTPTSRTAPIARPQAAVPSPHASPAPPAQAAQAPVPRQSRSLVPVLAVIGVVVLLLAAGAFIALGWLARSSDRAGSGESSIATVVPSSAQRSQPAPTAESVPPPRPPAPTERPAATPPVAPPAGTPPNLSAKPNAPASTSAAAAPNTATAPLPGPPPSASPAAATTGAPAQAANPTVVFRCTGEMPVCASLRSAMGPALKAQAIVSTNDPAAADILFDAQVEFIDERPQQMFGTVIVTRTYSIELSAQTTTRSATVPMPQASTVSYDARVGQEKLDGQMRVIAASAAGKIRAYWQGR